MQQKTKTYEVHERNPRTRICDDCNEDTPKPAAIPGAVLLSLKNGDRGWIVRACRECQKFPSDWHAGNQVEKSANETSEFNARTRAVFPSWANRVLPLVKVHT